MTPLSHLRASVLCFTIAAIASVGAQNTSEAAPKASATAPPALLLSIMRPVIAQGIGNFAALRAAAKSTDTNGTYFKNSALFAKLCANCVIADEFATMQYGERYTVSGFWPLDPAWTVTQKSAYIQKYLAPLVVGFTLTQGNEGTEHWFSWEQPSTKSFLFVETYRASGLNGFSIRVGHYLAQNVHYAAYDRLTPEQRDDLSRSARNFVQLGVQNAAQNFVSLRGAAANKDNNFFETSVTFGDLWKECEVDGVFAATDVPHPKWILECDTPPLGGAKSDIEGLIHAAVADALPYGFTVTTDPTYLGTDDYRWDRSSDAVSVDIRSYTNSNLTISYTIEIIHYTR